MLHNRILVKDIFFGAFFRGGTYFQRSGHVFDTKSYELLILVLLFLELRSSQRDCDRKWHFQPHG
ncbi:MAG: hypothetical protein LBC20_06460, partial [Planctomycetaceae bacterium]|nr:hypothetical protein [Planctomycetaceae bacterium]